MCDPNFIGAIAGATHISICDCVFHDPCNNSRSSRDNRNITIHLGKTRHIDINSIVAIVGFTPPHIIRNPTASILIDVIIYNPIFSIISKQRPRQYKITPFSQLQKIQTKQTC